MFFSGPRCTLSLIGNRSGCWCGLVRRGATGRKVVVTLRCELPGSAISVNREDDGLRYSGDDRGGGIVATVQSQAYFAVGVARRMGVGKLVSTLGEGRDEPRDEHHRAECH